MGIQLVSRTLKKCKLDIVEGEKANSVWLIVDDKYVLTKNKQFKNGKSVWECRGRRHSGCPFKMEVQLDGDVLSVIWMFSVKTHKLWTFMCRCTDSNV